jgi:large repetitive protein
MKYIAILFSLMLPAAAAWGQISVADYPKQFSCDVDATEHIEPPAAFSSCGEVRMSADDQVFSGGCLGTLVRTYTFRDGCGNEARAEQYIRLTDRVEPVLIGVPADIEDPVAVIPEAAMVSARDNSGGLVEVLMEEARSGNLLIRTWSSEDACGNRAVASQRIVLK